MTRLRHYRPEPSATPIVFPPSSPASIRLQLSPFPRSLAQGFGELADTVVRRVEALRNELDTDPAFQSVVRRSPTGPQIQRGTRFILRELVRTLLVDKGMKITRNHAIDLLHAVVPTAYCDLVLLDKHWKVQVERVRSRLKAAGMSVPIGRMFSGKASGIDRFLGELESG